MAVTVKDVGRTEPSPKTAGPRPARPLIPNKWLFAIHGWVGLSLGLPLFIICLSGSIAVVSHEIDWLLNPAIRANGPPAPVNWQAMFDSVRETYPEHSVRSLWAPVGSGFAAEAWLNTPAGTERIYIEPTTGEILGTAPWFNTQRFFRSFHRRFFWFSQWGIILVSAFALPLLISGATGLLFYKRWWVKLFTLRCHKGVRVFWSDAHRLTGVWTLLFAVMIALTGLWYLVERPVSRSFREYANRPERIDRDKQTELGPNAQPLSLSALADAARAASPGLEIRAVFPSSGPSDPIMIDGQAGAWLVRDRANRVTLDPLTGEVLGASRGENLHPVWRWSHTADVLHFGTFGGLGVKLIWLALGLLLSLLMPTGVYLFTKRAELMLAGAIKKATRNEIETPIKLKLRGTGWFGCIATTAVLILATVTTIQGLIDQVPAIQEMSADRGPVDYLGGPRVIAFCCGFLLFIGVATVTWYRVVWFRPSRRLVKSHAASKAV